MKRNHKKQLLVLFNEKILIYFIYKEVFLREDLIDQLD